jgi:hypothetical protein
MHEQVHTSLPLALPRHHPLSPSSVICSTRQLMSAPERRKALRRESPRSTDLLSTSNLPHCLLRSRTAHEQKRMPMMEQAMIRGWRSTQHEQIIAAHPKFSLRNWTETSPVVNIHNIEHHMNA